MPASKFTHMMENLTRIHVQPGAVLHVNGSNGSDSNEGRSWDDAKATIQAAVDAAAAGDRILIAPGDYVEAVTITKDNLTLIGVGGRGSVSVAPTASNATGILIDGTTASGRVEEVTLIDIGAAGVGTGVGLHVKGNIRRFTAKGCKFEAETGGASASARLESTAAGSVGDSCFEDCEFAWGDTALHFKVSGGGDPVTQTRVRDCLFHNYATVGLNVDTTHTTDLWAEDCTFGRKEDGTEPTDYVLASVASTTGFFSGNRFATATNATGVLTIAAGVIWAANATEAGWSTARPA